MPFTPADLDTLKAALALGAREVRYADGRQVTYRSFGEMRDTLALIAAEIAGCARPLTADRVASFTISGLSPGAPVFGGCEGGGGFGCRG